MRLKLESLEKLGWRFGLDTIQALLSELGTPQSSLRVVHVAGSNGKGSTCAFMAAFLRDRGYKTGLYTSPHLSDIRERFRVNGVWISTRDFDRHTRLVLEACRRVERKLGHLPTHFEALTAIAFCWFKEQRVDWLVLEVGLGGRLDATNVIAKPAVCLITPISLEHQNILGKTIGKIAWEKAGILKAGSLAATVQYSPEASRMIDRTARQRGARLWLLDRDFKFRKEAKGFYWEGPGLSRHFKLPGLADYQLVNAPLAIAGIQILRAFGVSSTPEMIQQSFGKTRWPGRAEVIRRKPLILLDGAHNPSAATLLSVFLDSRYPRKKWVVLNGFLKDKDYASVTRILQPYTAFAAVTEPESERAEDGMEVLKAWKKAGGPAGGVMRDWKKALALAIGESKKRSLPLLITGSLYLVGNCREQLIGKADLARI